MKLYFYGGAKMVTGVNYLLEIKDSSLGVEFSGQMSAPLGVRKILVDCGLVQGEKIAEKLNYEDWKFNPEEIDCVLITHSHLDHIGRLPKLFKDGFKGKVYSTPPIRDFAELALIDSANILKKEAKEIGAAPLYEVEDVVALMGNWLTAEYYKKVDIFPGVRFAFYNSGHILGSAFILLEAENKKIIFSGDLGNPPVPFLNPPDIPEQADFLIIESAYGNKLHEHTKERRDILEDIIEETIQKKGVLLIPAFAMERTQQMLFEINELVEKRKIPAVPIFIDSPLAMKLTAVYEKYESYFNVATLNILHSGDDIFNFPGLEITFTKEQSRRIKEVPPPKIIIAGSGMMQGGRILNHLLNYLSDPRTVLLIVSYQAEGSLGRKILDGALEVEILKQKIPVRAKVAHMESYSAHADQNQLLSWIAPLRKSLKKVFIVQGELASAEGLSVKIRDNLAINTEIPNLNEEVEL